jgi:hypothetical protein
MCLLNKKTLHFLKKKIYFSVVLHDAIQNYKLGRPYFFNFSARFFKFNKDPKSISISVQAWKSK